MSDGMDTQQLKNKFSKNLSINVKKDESGKHTFIIDVVQTVLNKVQKHCNDLDLDFKRTVLCGELLVFIKDFKITFSDIDDIELYDIDKVELYENRLMAVIESHLKACFESISVL